MSSNLGRAEHELTRRCMVKEGFEYFVSFDPESTFIPYKGLSVAEASVDGYRAMMGISTETAATDKRMEEYFRGFSEADHAAYAAALSGPPGTPTGTVIVGSDSFSFSMGGCAFQSQEALYGDVKSWQQAELTLKLSRPAAVVRHEPGFAAAEADWSACMSRANRPFASTEAAWSAGVSTSTNTDGALGPASAAEKEIAVADAVCRESTGYDDTLQSLTIAALSKYAGANEGEILRLIEILAEAEVRARRLLG